MYTGRERVDSNSVLGKGDNLFPFNNVPGNGHSVKTPNNKDTKDINLNYLLIDLVIH